MGAFAKLVRALVKSGEEDWEKELLTQEERFRAKAPMSSDIALAEASERMKKYQNLAYSLGYALRKSKAQSEIEKEVSGDLAPEELQELEASPGREMILKLPGKSAEWMDIRLLSKEAGPVTDPIRYGMQDLFADAMGYISKKKEEATKITADPETHPAYYPALAIGVPKAFAAGFKDAGKEVQEQTNKRVDTELEKAKREFEDALAHEYDTQAVEGAEAKAAALISGLAEAHVKKAEGELNQLANVYLGLATLLGSGSYVVGHSWAEKHDKALQELKAMREYLRRRAYLHPPVMIAETENPEVKPEPAPVEDAATAAAI